MRKGTANGDGHKISIQLMNEISMIVDGEYMEGLFEKSRKMRTMIAFLLIKQGESVSFAELGRVLWPENPISNETNAIKVLVCRVRAAMSEAHPALRECIKTKSGSYSWNMDLTSQVDIFAMADLCDELMSGHLASGEQYTLLAKLLGMYVGNLLPELSHVEWVRACDEKLHRDISEAAELVLNRLVEDNNWDAVVKICGLCIDAMPNDNQWRELRMNALLRLGRSRDAMGQYMDEVAETRHEAWGTRPGAAMELYIQAAQSEPTLGQGLVQVSSELMNHEDEGGALFCQYEIFKHVYQMQQRGLERYGNNTYLAIVGICGDRGRNIPVLAMEEAMQRLGRILQSGLRRGDTIARYTPTQYAVLLQGTVHEAVSGVLERMRMGFYDEMENINIRLEYEFKPLLAQNRRQARETHRNNGYVAAQAR